MENHVENQVDKDKKILEIGVIFYSIGIDSIEKAIKLRDHLQDCSGGKDCIKKLLNEQNV